MLDASLILLFLAGWYADTEVLRDLTDETRYNLLVPVAKALGLDTDTEGEILIEKIVGLFE